MGPLPLVLVVFCLLAAGSAAASFQRLTTLPEASHMRQLRSKMNTPLKWNIMVYDYAEEFDEISLDQAQYLIDHAPTQPTDIAVHIYVHTETQRPGTYLFRFFNHTAWSTIIPHSSPSINVSSEQTLEAFIRNSTTLDPAEHYLFVFAGHGWGWFLLPSTQETPMPFPMIRSAFQKAGIHLDLLVIDGCLESNIESAYEIQPITTYLWAMEDYGYDDGLFDPSAMLSVLENFPFNVPDEVDKLMLDFIRRFHRVPETNSTDSVLLDLRQLQPLVDFVRDVQLSDTEFDVADRVDPDYDGLYDVYSTIMQLPRVKDNPQKKQQFDTLFHQLVVDYRPTDPYTRVNAMKRLLASRLASASSSSSPSIVQSLSVPHTVSNPTPRLASALSLHSSPSIRAQKLRNAGPTHHGLSLVCRLGPPWDTQDDCWSICLYYPLQLSTLIHRTQPWMHCSC